MTVSIRHLREADIDGGLRLCRLAGWNQLRRDWMRLLAYQPDGCFVAESGEELVGTITTTCYGDSLAWIGMMLVHPDHRRRGIASLLMNRALQFLDTRCVRCIKLDATPEGRQVYLRMGFVDEYEIERWYRESSSINLAACDVPQTSDRQPIGDDAKAHYREIDLETFGADRWNWLERLLSESRVSITRGALAMLRPGEIANYLGPVIARNVSSVEQPIRQLIHSSDQHDDNRAMDTFWDVPVANQGAGKLASDLDFRVVRRLIRMRRGPVMPQHRPEGIFGLAGPSTG